MVGMTNDLRWTIRNGKRINVSRFYPINGYLLLLLGADALYTLAILFGLTR